ncbi:MAG: hypothetical protein ACXWWL_07125, partial [Candidatus Limnocylindria bacterium]
MRIAAGVERAVTALRPARIEWHGVDREQRASLEATVGRRGTPKGEEPSGPIYPSSFGVGSRPNARGRLARNAALALGIPGLARGNVLVHGSLGSTLAATAAGCAFTIVLDPRNLSGLRVRTLASIAARGGWIGAPSLGRRVLARRRLESSLRRLEGRITASHGEPLERFLARRAAELLRQLAAITIADHRVARRALAHGGLRAIVLPFDTPPGARGLIQAARQAGVPALVVQHGFASGAGFIHDGSEGDVAAVWSDADAELLRPHARGRVAVTGNPGVEQLLGQVGQMPTMPRGRGRSLVLVEYPFRVSTRIDSRVKHRQVLTALHALAATRSGTEVIIRPHPGDHEPRALEPIAAMFPGIHVRIDSASPIPGLLAECDLLVAALS